MTSNIRNYLGALIALLGTVLSLQLAAAPAPGTYRITSVHSGKALDVSDVSTQNGANVHQWALSGRDNQAWEIRRLDDGYYVLIARHSGKALDVAGSSTQNGANVQQYTLNYSWAQRFAIEETYNGSNRFVLRNRASNKVLDVANWSNDDGGNIHQWSAANTENQQWTFEPIAQQEVATTTINGVNFDIKTVGGITTDNGWNLWGNGYIQERTTLAGTSRISISARGQYANGWPVMTISIDGQNIATTTVDSASWKTFSYNVNGRAGARNIRITYSNDYYVSGMDRNLYIRNMTVANTITATPPTTSTRRTAQQMMDAVYRGTNYGQHHEAGKWSPIPADDLKAIRARGFNLLRIPVKWGDSADSRGNINATFMANIKTSVDRALAEGFMVVLDTHHEDWLDDNFNSTNLIRLKNIWFQIGNRFKGYPDRLMYETFNEPHNMAEPNVDQINNEIRSVIRNEVGERDRVIWYATDNWNWSENVTNLDFYHGFDPYVGATIHYYHPNEFTHKYTWSWPGTGTDSRQQLLDYFNKVEAWSNRTGYAIFLGEFGVNHGQASHDWNSVLRYYREVSNESKRRGWGYAVWEDDGWYKLFDRETNTYINSLEDALQP